MLFLVILSAPASILLRSPEIRLAAAICSKKSIVRPKAQTIQRTADCRGLRALHQMAAFIEKGLVCSLGCVSSADRHPIPEGSVDRAFENDLLRLKRNHFRKAPAEGKPLEKRALLGRRLYKNGVAVAAASWHPSAGCIILLIDSHAFPPCFCKIKRPVHPRITAFGRTDHVICWLNIYLQAAAQRYSYNYIILLHSYKVKAKTSKSRQARKRKI